MGKKEHQRKREGERIFWSFPCSPLLITNYWRAGWTVVVVVRATQRSIIFWVYLVRLFPPPPFTYLLVTHTPKFFIRRYYLLFLYITKSLTLERIQSSLSGFNIAPFLPLCLSMSLPLLLTLKLSLPLPPCGKIERWKNDTDKVQRPSATFPSNTLRFLLFFTLRLSSRFLSSNVI
jgi:hypothetical protein